jgi:DNA-binding response OmpR family regulator
LGLVLVVEDERSIARLLERILARAGYAVLLAQTGHEALALAVERQPDVVTLDLILPGLSGEETLAALKADERTRAIPVIVISIRGDEPPAVRLPVYASLRKPLDQNAVLDAIAGAVRSRQPGATDE